MVCLLAGGPATPLAAAPEPVPEVFELERVVKGEVSGGAHPEVKNGNVAVEFEKVGDAGGTIRLTRSCYDRERAHAGPHKVRYRVSWALAQESGQPLARLLPGARVTLTCRLEIESGAGCRHAAAGSPLVWIITNGGQESALMRARPGARPLCVLFTVAGNQRLSLSEKPEPVKARISLQSGPTQGGYFGLIAHLGYPGVTAEAMYVYQPVVMKPRAFPSPAVSPAASASPGKVNLPKIVTSP